MALARSIDDSSVRYGGGAGTTVEDAIVILGAGHDLVGTMAEYAWLFHNLGVMNVDWTLRSHASGMAGGRRIDTVIARLHNGEERTVYFDVTEPFGNWENIVRSDSDENSPS